MTKEMEERLSKANTLREEEKYGESAKEYTECLLELTELNDAEGLIHALGGMSLVYKLQLRKVSSPVYKNLSLAFAQEGYRIAEINKERLGGRVLSIAYRCLGDALLMNSKTVESLPLFELALSITTADKCEKGNLKAHIGEIKYILGEKEKGIEMIREALGDIRTGDMNTYAPRVWETGSLNKLAITSALEGKKEEALVTIKESLEIARAHNLTIRLREAEEILEKINKGETNFSV